MLPLYPQTAGGQGVGWVPLNTTTAEQKTVVLLSSDSQDALMSVPSKPGHQRPPDLAPRGGAQGNTADAHDDKGGNRGSSDLGQDPGKFAVGKPRRRTVSRLVRHATAGVVSIETGSGSESASRMPLSGPDMSGAASLTAYGNLDEQIKLCCGKPSR
jgi:hypothetical protein